jgi:hypothetical protein
LVGKINSKPIVNFLNVTGIYPKNKNFVEIHPRNIPAKFGSKWPNGFRGED